MDREPFVGRLQELDALLAAIDRPAGQILLCCGDPGTGKSALLAELHPRPSGAPAPARRISLLYRPAQTDTLSAIPVELMEALLETIACFTLAPKGYERAGPGKEAEFVKQLAGEGGGGEGTDLGRCSGPGVDSLGWIHRPSRKEVEG